MPTAVARPWPSGPVVVSTPGVWPYSGWPGVFEPSWRKCLISSMRHASIAGQMQQRVEQHRAVAGRQHEAVAVGPVRIGRVELQELREQHGGDVGHAHRHAGMAGLGLLDGIHGERADGVGHAVMGHARIGSLRVVGLSGRHGGRRRSGLHCHARWPVLPGLDSMAALESNVTPGRRSAMHRRRKQRGISLRGVDEAIAQHVSSCPKPLPTQEFFA